MDMFHIPAAGILSSVMLLLTLISSTTTSAQGPSACDPAACRALRIAYPFWLGGTHPPECGYSAFKVTCDTNGTASLKNTFWTYQILHISYDASSLTVANVDLFHDGMCNMLQVNASSDLGLAPFGISKANQELFFLYNCTTLSLPPPPTWAPVSCTGSLGANSSKFAWLAGGYRPDDAWRPVEGNCTVSMMPVLGYDGAVGKDYRLLMKGGFLLDYKAGDCTACMESGGLCRINTTYDVFECHCPDGVSDLVSCAGN